MASAAHLVDVGIIVVMTVAIWVGSGWLEGASEDLSTHYGLPPVVQGSVVTAVGSSFPELATVVVAAVLTGSLDLGVGTIVGSAIFNVLVIPALAGVMTADPLESSRTLVYKEAQFYMLAVSVLLIVVALGVIYYPVPDAEHLSGSVTRELALIPLALYGLYLFIQAQDTADFVSDSGEETEIAVRRQWGYLLAALVLILAAVHQLVGAVETLGAAAGIPPFLMGATVAAGATSLPDALVSVRAARDERAVASVANVLGSNTFDLLVAIPAGVLIVGRKPMNFEMVVPMFGALTLATILLFVTLRTDLTLTRPESAGLLLAYLLFVAWVVLESVGTAVDYLPNAAG
jgi:cation:H+ antiporter